jgi:hypothetical protein
MRGHSVERTASWVEDLPSDHAGGGGCVLDGRLLRHQEGWREVYGYR